MLTSFLKSVRIARWLWVAFGIFVLTVLHGAYYTYLILPRVYYSTAQIEALRIESNENNGASDPTSLQGEIKVIRSGAVLLPVIHDLNLDKTWAKRVFDSRLDALPEQDALLYMGSITQMYVRPGTNIIEIRVASEIPKEASDIANAIAEHYRSVNDLYYMDALSDQIAILDARKAAAEKVRSELSLQGVQIAPGPTGLIDADIDARKQDMLTGGQEHTRALDPFREAQHDLDLQQHIVDQMNARLERPSTQELDGGNPMRFFSRAVTPENPSSPNNAFNMVLSIIEGFYLAPGVATFVEWAIWYVLSRAAVSGTDKNSPHPSDEY